MKQVLVGEKAWPYGRKTIYINKVTATTISVIDNEINCSKFSRQRGYSIPRDMHSRTILANRDKIERFVEEHGKYDAKRGCKVWKGGWKPSKNNPCLTFNSSVAKWLEEQGVEIIKL